MMRYTHGNVSYGPLSGCLLLLGAVVIAAALGGIAVSIVAWPFLTPWPLWLQVVTEIAYIPTATILLGLLAYAGSSHGKPPPPPDQPPGPRDWSPPDGLGQWYVQHGADPHRIL